MAACPAAGRRPAVRGTADAADGGAVHAGGAARAAGGAHHLVLLSGPGAGGVTTGQIAVLRHGTGTFRKENSRGSRSAVRPVEVVGPVGGDDHVLPQAKVVAGHR